VKVLLENCAAFLRSNVELPACSNAGHPFGLGFTLAKLAAVTVDKEGNETFATSNALDRLRKVSLTSV
jgi:hypothetical protein